MPENLSGQELARPLPLPLFIKKPHLLGFIASYWAHPFWQVLGGQEGRGGGNSSFRREEEKTTLGATKQEEVSTEGSEKYDQAARTPQVEIEAPSIGPADLWIRVSFRASKYLLGNLEKQGKPAAKLSALRETTFVETFGISDFYQAGPGGSEPLGIARINAMNGRGMDCYYYLNVAPVEIVREHLSGRDITNVLWIPVDHDMPLPVGIKRLYAEAKLVPWLVTKTSVIDGVPRYQVLIAVDVSESREFGLLRDTTREANRILGGDSSVCDPARLFRLPGTRNWKGAERGVHSGFCRIVEGVGQGKIAL